MTERPEKCPHVTLKRKIAGETAYYQCECGQKFHAGEWDGNVRLVDSHETPEWTTVELDSLAKEIAADCYQLAGVLNAPERVLDALNDFVHGKPYKSFLPVSPDEKGIWPVVERDAPTPERTTDVIEKALRLAHEWAAGYPLQGEYSLADERASNQVYLATEEALSHLRKVPVVERDERAIFNKRAIALANKIQAVTGVGFNPKFNAVVRIILEEFRK